MAKFCAHCGNVLHTVWSDAESRERPSCSVCRRIHYEGPRLLVWCFAHWRQRIVLCRRAQEPARGFWTPPAGFVEAGETLEEAMSREMFEEAGLAVLPDNLALYHVSSIPHINEVYVGFRTALAVEPVLTAGPESLEVGLYAESDPPLRDMAFKDMLANVPQTFFRHLRDGEFPIKSDVVRPPVTR